MNLRALAMKASNYAVVPLRVEKRNGLVEARLVLVDDRRGKRRHVRIVVSEQGELIEFYCSCPGYSVGALCKHVARAYDYVLRILKEVNETC